MHGEVRSRMLRGRGHLALLTERNSEGPIRGEEKFLGTYEGCIEIRRDLSGVSRNVAGGATLRDWLRGSVPNMAGTRIAAQSPNDRSCANFRPFTCQRDHPLITGPA